MKEKTDNEVYASIEERDLISEFYFGKGMTGIFSINFTWNDLMPVVEKIGKLYDTNLPKSEEIMTLLLAGQDPIDRHYIDVISTSIYSPINEVYKVVTEFIKWYNKNGK